MRSVIYYLKHDKSVLSHAVIKCSNPTCSNTTASQSTEMYISRRLALVTIKDTFSGYSCARKMCHLLLAGYEDVPSFLNQLKLKVQPYIVL